MLYFLRCTFVLYFWWGTAETLVTCATWGTAEDHDPCVKRCMGRSGVSVLNDAPAGRGGEPLVHRRVHAHLHLVQVRLQGVRPPLARVKARRG